MRRGLDWTGRRGGCCRVIAVVRRRRARTRLDRTARRGAYSAGRSPVREVANGALRAAECRVVFGRASRTSLPRDGSARRVECDGCDRSDDRAAPPSPVARVRTDGRRCARSAAAVVPKPVAARAGPRLPTAADRGRDSRTGELRSVLEPAEIRWGVAARYTRVGANVALVHCCFLVRFGSRVVHDELRYKTKKRT